MIITCAAKAENVISRRIGDELVVLGDTADSAHILNKTAAAVWELCDGERGLDDIAGCLCERFEVSFEEARADIEEIIGRLMKVGILVHVAEPTVERKDSQAI